MSGVSIMHVREVVNTTTAVFLQGYEEMIHERALAFPYAESRMVVIQILKKNFSDLASWGSCGARTRSPLDIYAAERRKYAFIDSCVMIEVDGWSGGSPARASFHGSSLWLSRSKSHAL
jgi:hypothetical protein